MTENLPTVLQRIAKKDKSAVDECLNKYGALIWALSKKFTGSEIEAEAATEQIFADIWNCADCFDLAKSAEKDFILFVILRNLFEPLLTVNKDIRQTKHSEKAPQKLSLETIKGLQAYLSLRKFMDFQKRQL